MHMNDIDLPRTENFADGVPLCGLNFARDLTIDCALAGCGNGPELSRNLRAFRREHDRAMPRGNERAIQRFYDVFCSPSRGGSNRRQGISYVQNAQTHVASTLFIAARASSCHSALVTPQSK